MLWSREGYFGAEFAEITILRTRLLATGVQIGSDPAPYRVDYSLETDAPFETRSMQVKATGNGWHRSVDLRRTADGWSADMHQDGEPPFAEWKADLPSLVEAKDCDLGFSPVTNMMPILRAGILDGGGPAEIVATWISVPDLSVHAERQRYAFLGSEPGVTIVRFESLDGTFAADLRVDTDGVVIDYPGVAARIG
jgi:hypothetical protein